jgi:hypothetical protein
VESVLEKGDSRLILGLSFAPIFGLIGGQSIELGYGYSTD